MKIVVDGFSTYIDNKAPTHIREESCSGPKQKLILSTPKSSPLVFNPNGPLII